jgi:hypothetical protein
MSNPSPSIFKAYDIRGIAGDDIDSATAHAIGRAFARVISTLGDKPASELRLGLGRDMRNEAEELAAAYAAGPRRCVAAQHVADLVVEVFQRISAGRSTDSSAGGAWHNDVT